MKPNNIFPLKNVCKNFATIFLDFYIHIYDYIVLKTTVKLNKIYFRGQDHETGCSFETGSLERLVYDLRGRCVSVIIAIRSLV